MDQILILLCIEFILFCSINMDIVLGIIGFLLIVAWFVGAIAPILPWPPLAFLGLLFLHWTSTIQFPAETLLVLGLLTLATVVGDYLIPLRWTKKYGGTKAGTRWSVVGMILGLFFLPPVWLIIGPMIGAFVGEYMSTRDKQHALRSARWSFVGFLLSTGIKLIVCGIILWYGIIAVLS